jgi:hypothetical protein
MFESYERRWENNIKIILKATGLVLFFSALGPTSGCYKHGNGISFSTNVEKFGLDGKFLASQKGLCRTVSVNNYLN